MDMQRYGEKAAQVWAKHRNKGRFCSKECHDRHADTAREQAINYARTYQWIKNGKQLVDDAQRMIRPLLSRARRG